MTCGVEIAHAIGSETVPPDGPIAVSYTHLVAKLGQETGERERSDHADDSAGHHRELGREGGGDCSGLEVTKSRTAFDDGHLQ